MQNYFSKWKLVIFSFIFYFVPLLVLSQGTYQAYFGNLHSHTSNSDGTGEPADAYTYARYTAGLDFLAVTDHLEQIGNIPIIDPEWSGCQDDADDATVNGTFVGIAGWEWGSPVHGHVNVFNTNDLITDAVNLWYTTDLPAFYNWVLTHAPAFAQFNHPGDEIYFTNWNNFAYVSNALDNVFPLIEFQTVQEATDYYELALAQGWHLSPVWNQDNHSADWGTKNDCRAGIWATSLTRQALFNAINAGRTFATMDKNAKIWIDLSGTPMGGQLPIQILMPLHLYLSDANNESWLSIQLVTKNGVLMDLGVHTGNLDTTFNINLTTDQWVFVRAIQADGNYLWSAPVYVTGTITDVSSLTQDIPFQLFPNPAKEYFIVNTNDDNSRIEIFNINGALLYTTHFEKRLQINSGILSPGIYLVKISVSEKTFIKKVLLTG
jgi:hypothetical protein